jgi:hypothetical protein
MGGDAQWADGRSAMELARYMTAHLPRVPYEMECALSTLVPQDAEFDWDAEYVTALPGAGQGRNHDAVLRNQQIFVGIEGKADESFGNGFVHSEYIHGSENKKRRITVLSDMIWGDSPELHGDIRYQLLTAAAAILLEANRPDRKVSQALFLVIVFKKPGKVSPERLEANRADLMSFLKSTNAVLQGNLYRIPTKYGAENGIDLYLKKIEIDL